ncbi:MAG TPA: nif-specific transcriptional activator NifA [Candidatus Hydrogenedentes bacterium]|nr:nif-specific transcriptional activator NifA [Candidatus Hydrogenedentota bacterium]NLT61640.1 nif-specific transcriptional activator NifA [Candidatus Hydrogenedentota bacterium]HNZ18306.1 nif-specific transcriptional activator NifA [Candidatus Hydrogenedentota bacterium]HOH33748.1 nif-specific transcriptional activator NifA [Candidatus Hydrogenedentota bacterium]HPA04008.1 nif-specific transcriptional activator NifA [Candidatus Hydrogenedentota bacterium]
MSEPADPLASHRRNELALLFDISLILDRSLDLRDEVGAILRALAKHTGMVRGTLTLLNRETDEILIEEGHGLSAKQRERTRYRPGEGVTGMVIQTGRPMVIPRISEEPLFLDKTGARSKMRKDEIAFVCVPIKIENEVLGALSADRIYHEPVSLDEDLHLLSIIARMIAQAVQLRRKALEDQQRLIDQNKRLQQELQDRFRPANIIGNSGVMQQVYNLVAQVAKSDTTVLIRGESGVGKELVAQAIHYNSHRTAMPFIKVNCAALPESVIESELFGHEKGAFTGAIRERKGRFELADRGSIFLDEIGDLTPAMQIRLLRVLQEREFERVGSTDTIKVNVRVIAATNRELEMLMEQGTFRQDLYYRLNVFPIHLPPLRERKSDILDLANFFVEKYSKANGKNVRRISTPAIDMLMSYHWPGNVRELENCIERAVLLSNDDVVHGHHLPPTLQTAEASNTVMAGTLENALDAVEREMIIEALKNARGNKAKAARDLGISERIMGLRVRKHAISTKAFRPARTRA